MSRKSEPATLITNDTVTLILNGEVFAGTREYAQKSGVLVALKQKDYQKAADLLNKAKAIVRKSLGQFTIENGVIYHNDVPVRNVVADRIVALSDAGLPFMPAVRFLENILQNPSMNSKEAGYKFLELKGLPLTEDGHFLAYKSVRSDYKSKTAGREPAQVSTDGGVTFQTVTGNLPNNVGNILKIERNMVDDDREKQCSYGLHVGSLGYSGPQGWFYNQASGDKILIVKVNPRDIVSIPNDATAEKLRVCQYEVLDDFKAAYSAPLVSNEGAAFESGSDSVEVFCSENFDGCGWEGSFSELRQKGFGYCPNCGNDEALDTVD